MNEKHYLNQFVPLYFNSLLKLFVVCWKKTPSEQLQFSWTNRVRKLLADFPNPKYSRIFVCTILCSRNNIILRFGVWRKVFRSFQRRITTGRRFIFSGNQKTVTLAFLSRDIGRKLVQRETRYVAFQITHMFRPSLVVQPICEDLYKMRFRRVYYKK